MEENTKRFIIEISPEFKEILDRLEKKIKDITWDGIDKVGSRTLTKILAKKINASKIV